MPLPDLGLIIVDEEHESSFKQYEPRPLPCSRYGSLMPINTVVLSSRFRDAFFRQHVQREGWRYHLVQLFQRFTPRHFPNWK